jgi:MYM-type Zinc finger with FCS sequence motif
MSGRGRGKRIKPIDPTQDDSKDDKSTKKTSKKKQFPVVAVITPDGIEGNLLSASRRPLIVHLPIQSKDVHSNDMPITYDPHPPVDAQPYDINADNPFCDEVEVVESFSLPSSTIETTTNTILSEQKPSNDTTENSTIDYYNLKSTLLVQFKDSSEIKTIPNHSDSACFWCCHTFQNRPVVLPIRDAGDYLIVTGNFCCPECATAYLFDMRQDSHTRWEQLALLYRIYSDSCQGKIHPAPPRSSLSLFGGPLSIQEYRSLILSHKVRIDIHLPPMVSILATMDTKPIDFYDTSLTKNVTETVKERLQKAEEVLRLRRTKPLKAWESTLDACINLKIKHDTTTISA